VAEKRHGRALLTGVAALSAALIGYELALTNVFAVLLQYHYISVIVSLALFGIGAGALLAYRAKGENGRSEADRPSGLSAAGAVVPFSGISLLCGACIALTGLFLALYPYISHLALYALAAAVPFVLFGWSLGVVFTGLRGKAAHVYAADLVGAGAGVALAIAAMNAWGGLAALQLFGLLAAAAGLVCPLVAGEFGRERRLWKWSLSALLPLAVWALSISPAGGRLAPDPAGFRGAPPDKTLVGVLRSNASASIVHTDWDAFARTDVVATDDPSYMMLFVDGGAGSYMYRFDGNPASAAFLMQTIEFLPFAISPIDSALVIGAGGGRDVLYAMLAGARDITAVEVSRGIVDAMRKFGDFNGHLAAREGVTWLVGEGRHVLERTDDRYDAIVLDLVYSQTGGARNQTLSENFVFTLEAFERYVERLNDGGRIIVIAHHGLEGIRAYYTGLKALMDARGLSAAEAAGHTALLLAPGGSRAPGTTVAVIARDPLTEEELQVLQAGALAHGLTPLFLPKTQESLLQPLLEGRMSFDAFVKADPDYDVYPVTDDRPFFFHIDRRFPRPYLQWLAVNAILTLAAVLAVRLGSVYRRALRGGRFDWRMTAYLALLGIGYVCVQTPVIQKSMLVLGSPVLSAAAVLFAMLVGGGAGSLIAGRIRLDGRAQRALWAALPPVLGGFILALDGALPALIAQPQAVRLAAVCVLVGAVSVVLGMPMPVGLRRIERDRPGASAFGYAVNGMAALWGSWLAVAVSFAGGFTPALLLGLICYALVAVLGWRASSAA
jgi:hypothetical protein